MKPKISEMYVFTDQNRPRDDGYSLGGDAILISDKTLMMVVHSVESPDAPYRKRNMIMDYKVQVITTHGLLWTWCRDCVSLI